MKHLILFFSFLFCSSVYSQKGDKNNSISIYQLYEITSEDDAIKLAKFHVKHSKPILLLRSGIVSMYNGSDSLIEAKYNLSFHDFGCISPDNNLIEAYSNKTFNFLDKKYGKEWREEVRDDVLFLKK